jgi:hypothetical protein
MVLEKFRVVGMVALGLGLAGVVTGAALLFWFSPAESPGGMPRTRERGLDTALIDQLELWIEEIDAQRQAGLPLPARPVFVIEDIPVIAE